MTAVTAVAQALHLSASAVSQQLAALQRTVAVPLTRQRGRVLVLTPAGEHLADAAGEVLEAMARAHESVAEYLRASDEPVTVTAFHSAGLAWFPSLIERSLSEPDGPQLRCRDEDVSIGEFVDLVADHDIVIAHRPLASPPWPSRRVSVSPLLVEPIDLALPRSHPLAAKASVQLSDLSDETWLAAHEGFTLEPLLVQATPPPPDGRSPSPTASTSSTSRPRSSPPPRLSACCRATPGCPRVTATGSCSGPSATSPSGGTSTS